MDYVPGNQESRERRYHTQKYDYAAITGGFATFGSTAALAQFGTDGTHQIANAWTICIIHNGQDTIASVINP